MAEGFRIGILVVAYNAASTLAWVLDRIPEAFRAQIDAVLVSDDHSSDSTYEVTLDYQRLNASLPITVVRQPRNLGYGGNQKFGYRWMIENGLDAVVLLHGDGQYAPEVLPEMVAPLREGRADCVLGSRMLVPGAARAGGMPFYKYVGNRILTRFQNAVSGLRLSEWHSGYRAFSVAALDRIPFQGSSDGFDFDTEILLQLHASGARIVEIPIPTYYGDEICHVNGLAYARDVSLDVVRFRLGRMGFGTRLAVPPPPDYEWKDAPDSSHRTVLAALDGLAPGRILDLGCGSGLLAAELRARGHAVTGVDRDPAAEAAGRVDRLLPWDLDRGLPPEILDEPPFDAVVAADVLEHLRDPEGLLTAIHRISAPNAALVASFPNVGHWYPRGRILLGRFDYDRRGILDAGHLRFFTRRSFERMARRAGWLVEARRATGVPLEVLDRGRRPRPDSAVRTALRWLDRAGRRVWPGLFAYQYVTVLRPDPVAHPPADAGTPSTRIEASQVS